MEFIYEIKNCLSDEYCDRLIERYTLDVRSKPGETVGGVNTNWKKSLDLRIGELFDWTDVTQTLVQKVRDGLSEYEKYYDDNDMSRMNLIKHMINDAVIYNATIQQTEEGGFYRWHHDSLFSKHVRILTYIFYLNDVPVEHGGCTEFLMGKKIQPKKGTLLFFPATWNYIHRGKKLEKGNKYIATGFVYGD